MIVAMVIVNVVFASLVYGGILALHGWAIATDPHRRTREIHAVRAERTRRARWEGRPGLAT